MMIEIIESHLQFATDKTSGAITQIRNNFLPNGSSKEISNDSSLQGYVDEHCT